jgi:hypothetical protein
VVSFNFRTFSRMIAFNLYRKLDENKIKFKIDFIVFLFLPKISKFSKKTVNGKMNLWFTGVYIGIFM